MKIVLGIYTSKWWVKFRETNPEWLIYPFGSSEGSVMEVVEENIVKATEINFILDGIQLPLDIIHSYSCNELSVILNTPEHLNKTIFWLKGQKFKTKKLLQKIKKCMEYGAKTEQL